MAVISRAEAFLYPDKAFSSTSATELSNQLDKLRVNYLERVLRRCTRVARDEKEKSMLLTPASSKRKRPSEFLEGTPPDIRVKVAKLIQRTAPSPSPLAGILETHAQEWERCLRDAAIEGGFDAQGLLEAFRRAPKGQPLDKVVKVLQYVCEVANAEALLQLKGFLLDPTAHTEEIYRDDREVVNLHTQIRTYETVSFMAQAQKLICQLFYYDWFQGEANTKRDAMREGTNENKRIAQSARRKGLEVRQRDVNTNTALDLQRKYVTQLITSQTNLDEASVRTDVNNNYHKGEVLSLLLTPRNGEERREGRFIYLLPLFESPDRPPLLNVNNYRPPIATKSEISKKISTSWYTIYILSTI